MHESEVWSLDGSRNKDLKLQSDVNIRLYSVKETFSLYN